MSTDPIRVSVDELKNHWFSEDATGMTLDQHRGVRQVKMRDGTIYETPLDEFEDAS